MTGSVGIFSQVIVYLSFLFSFPVCTMKIMKPKG